MSAVETAIWARGLSRRFGKRVAVRDLDLEIPPGCVCGFVGPNGSGKTTTIKMLLGLLTPSAGEARVLGLHPIRQSLELRTSVGYVPERHNIYEWMKVKHVLELARGLHPRWDDGECRRLVKLLDLPLDLKTKKLSRGELAKLALTVALSPRPRLLILDEPTSGLDPLVRRDFLEAIIHIIEGGERTVFFSTHILSDVERVADRVIILREGKIAAREDLEVLRRRYKKASLLFSTPPAPETAVPGALRVERGVREWVAFFEALDESEIHNKAKSLGATNCLIQPMSFEDIFVLLLEPPGENDAC